MAAPCDNFDRVNDFIEEVCQNVEENRQLCHLICLDSHKLFQPWPSNAVNNERTEQNTDNSSDSQSASGRNANKTDDNVLSAVETKALAEVEDILSKAQKARKLQAKLTRTTAKKDRTHLEASQSTKQNKPQQVGENINPHDKDEPYPHSPPTHSSDSNYSEMDSDQAVISESKLQSLLSHTTTKPSTSTIRNQVTPKVRKNLSAKGAPKTSAPSRNVVKVPKPTSAAKMQYKTSSSEIGKHNVNSRRPPSGSSNRTLQKHKDQTAAVSQKSKPPNYRSQSAEGRPSDARKLTRSQSEERRPKVKSSERVIKSAERKQPQQDQVQSKRTPVMDSAVVDVTDGTERMSIEDSNTEDSLVASSPSFLLKKDASTLKIPVKLRKLHCSAGKLREKLSSTSSMEATSESVEHHFKQRLEAKFSHVEAMSLGDLEVKLQQLHAECSQLCFVARELQKLATNITGICTWQEIYRTKAMLHTITLRYNELQQDIQQLRKVEKKLLAQTKHKTPKTPPRNSSHRRTLSLPLPTSSWIPSHTEKKNYSHMISPTSDGAEGASSGCSSIWPSSTGSSSVMQYSKAKDFRRLTALQYQAQFVMWQMDVEKLIADDILPLLREMDPRDDEFIPLYRTIYGLLCQSAEAYPSLVRDNIGDSDEENGDGDHG